MTYQLPHASKVELAVYNLLGQKIETLVPEYQTAGSKSVTWDASDQPSGVYFIKLTAGSESFTKKVLLLK
ncbi:MAG: T9SS type A sorting domain-containing protein [candidate division Zixibacteria bacterium]|nr:T9SS type A sorting domain-containing protein [candidate division Zixibacteria bacterium]